ncbi:MAG: VWA domain-containing protein [Azoarcus sp.]|jgi:Ca-activated chloride channel family protein|nr:VWA domain-containing protein [Azoarcus sp.]
MLRNALARFAQLAGENLATKPVTVTVPDIPQTLAKCLSTGCRVASASFLVLAVIFSPATKAQTWEASDKTESPYFYMPDGDPSVDALPLKATEVDVKIAGVIADVTVTQTYRNEGSRPIEAKYVFPGSTRAAVHALNVRLADRLIVAQIREKVRARQEYEQAKAQGKTAALLEQHRPNVFQMNVANIMPGETVRVELRYTELLANDAGRYRFVFPTVVGPRYASPQSPTRSEQWISQPTLPEGVASPAKFSMKVALDTPIGIKEVVSSSHAIDVKQPNDKRAEVRLAADPTRAANNRDFILDYRLAGNAVESGVMLVRGKGGDAENFFLAMVEPPKAVPERIITPRDYVFVLDVSGSMHGFPLDTAKVMMRELLSGLRPTDTFNVMLFESSNAFLNERSVPATGENIERALSMIGQRGGGGGTELIPALHHVYIQPKPEDVSRTVVIVTDGFVSVESEAFGLVRKNLDQANLFAFGIGSSVNRHLIEGLARAGMGTPFVVTKPDEAKDAAKRFREMISAPVLTSVKARFEGIEAYDTVPDALPDVLAGRPLVIFGKWRDAGDGASPRLTIEGRRADGEYRQVLPVADAVDGERFPALRHLWARQRIAEISDQEALIGGDSGLREQITALGLKYSLLTKYTSFIAVDHEIRNPNPQGAVSVNQPQPLPEGVSNLAVSGAYVPGAPEPQTLGALFVTLSMLAMIARRASRQRRRHWTL